MERAECPFLKIFHDIYAPLDKLLIPVEPGGVSDFFEVFYERTDWMNSAGMTDEKG